MSDRALPSMVGLALALVWVVAGTTAAGDVHDATLDAPRSQAYIQGRVISEETGAPLEYANVIADDLRTGEILGAMSGPQGEYTIAAPAGLYLVRSLYLGYSVGRVDSVRVETGAVVQVDFRLPVWGLSRADAMAETLGVDLANEPLKLRLEVSTDRERYRIGDEVGLCVRIANGSRVPVHLPMILDGSLSGGRYPVLEITAVGDGVGVRVTPPVNFCGNQRRLRTSDVSQVAPGSEFNPWPGAGGIVPLRMFNLEILEPGAYTLRIRFLMNEPDLRRWWGTVSGPVEPELSRQLRTLPMINLEGLCVIEVE